MQWPARSRRVRFGRGWPVILAAVLNLRRSLPVHCRRQNDLWWPIRRFVDYGSHRLGRVVGAIIWNLLTWLVGLPSSSSHALFGGLIGAVHRWCRAQLSERLRDRLEDLAASHRGALGCWACSCLVHPVGLSHYAQDAERVQQYRVQVRAGVTASMVALAHGTSDGQKTMGVITLVLMAANLQPSGTGPQLWVIITAGVWPLAWARTQADGASCARWVKGSSRSRLRRAPPPAPRPARQSWPPRISVSGSPPHMSAPGAYWGLV